MILLILSAGAFVRFSTIDSKICWHDEALTLQVLSGYPLREIIAKDYTCRVLAPAELMRYQTRNPEHGLGDTLTCLLRENALHQPLYYVCAWLAAGSGDQTLHQARFVSAIFGALLPAAAAWLAYELAGSIVLSITAAALFAFSPFFVVYSQEAREYALWGLAMLLNTAALARAWRNASTKNKMLYGASLSFALYSHFLSLPAAIAQVIYIISARTENANKLLLPWALAFASVLPWEIAGLFFWQKMLSTPAFINLDSNRQIFFQLTAGNLLSPFFDSLLPAREAMLALQVLVIALELFSLVFVAIFCERRIVWMAFCLGAPALLTLIVLDLLLGGARITGARYLTPTVEAMVLCVALALAPGNGKNALRIRDKKWVAAAVQVSILSGLLALQVVSLEKSTHSNIWWNKVIQGSNISTIADKINEDSAPLVVSSPGLPNEGQILALSHLLSNKAQILLVPRDIVPDLPRGFTSVYVVSTSRDLLSGLARKYHVVLLHFGNDETVWQMVRLEVQSPSGQ